MPRMYIYVCADDINVDEIRASSKGYFLSWPERTNHPTVLAKTVDHYVDAFFRDNDDWHIVTYSSLFVLRIQRNILDGRIAASEVSIVFPERKEGKITFPSTSFDPFGVPSGYWPYKLLKEEIEEARQIYKIQQQRNKGDKYA